MGEIKAKTMIQKMGFSDPDKKTPEHDKIQTWCYGNIRTILESLFPTLAERKEAVEIEFSKWEYSINQISNGNCFILGFVDLYFQLRVASKKALGGYSTYRIYIEIKPRIPSLGELIRQISFYRTYIERESRGAKNIYIVISPEDQYSDILKEQGIYFYKYKDETKLF